MKDIQSKFLFVTITRNTLANIDEFINSWHKGYNYSNMEFYTDIISKEQIDPSELQRLFKWKNGMPLSSKKTDSFETKILNKIDTINDLKKQWDEQVFKDKFDGISTVWQIFLLHIIRPDYYPIFDKHVYRACKYIKEQIPDAKLPLYDRTKLDIYWKEYLPFYLECKEQMDDRFTSKNLDDALWTFGKFLSEYPKLVL